MLFPALHKNRTVLGSSCIPSIYCDILVVRLSGTDRSVLESV